MGRSWIRDRGVAANGLAASIVSASVLLAAADADASSRLIQMFRAVSASMQVVSKGHFAR